MVRERVQQRLLGLEEINKNNDNNNNGGGGGGGGDGQHVVVDYGMCHVSFYKTKIEQTIHSILYQAMSPHSYLKFFISHLIFILFFHRFYCFAISDS
jgi:hypothetical protein